MRYVKGTIVTAATVAGVAGVLALNPGVADTMVDSAVRGADASGESGDAASDPSTGKGTAGTATAEPGAAATGGDTAGSATTYTGSVYTTPWGPIQIEATIADGEIVDIAWISLPNDRHSAGINGRAAPALVEEALAAQSARVDSISGASWTSEGFRYSLQSILDQAGL